MYARVYEYLTWDIRVNAVIIYKIVLEIELIFSFPKSGRLLCKK